MTFLVWRKDFEEDSEENPQQAVGAGESQEKEGIYRWTGGQVIIHVCVCVCVYMGQVIIHVCVCVCVHGTGDYTRVCVCVCVCTWDRWLYTCVCVCTWDRWLYTCVCVCVYMWQVIIHVCVCVYMGQVIIHVCVCTRGRWLYTHTAVPKLGLGFLKKLLFHKGFIKLIKSDRKDIYAFYVKTFVHAVLMNFLFNKIYISWFPQKY